MNEPTNEQKRVKIAEACGWKRREPFQSAAGTVTQEWEKRGEITDDGCGGHTLDELPDYFHDLNACSEMEKVLTAEQCEWYWNSLCRDEPTEHATEADGWFFHFTAAKRAETFGRTLKLW